MHAFQKVVAPYFHELGLHKSTKNSCSSRTTQRIKIRPVPLCRQGPVNSHDSSIEGLILAGSVHTKKQGKFTVLSLGEGPTQYLSNTLQHPRQLHRQISEVQQQSLVVTRWCRELLQRRNRKHLKTQFVGDYQLFWTVTLNHF